MTNNETLRRIYESLGLGEDQVSEIFRQIGHPLDNATWASYVVEPTEEAHVECPNLVLSAFLEGLILALRGVNEKRPGPPTVSSEPLDNSDILKKLRVALDMHQTDVVTTLSRSGLNPTKTDLAAWFRKKGLSQYRPCSDAVLRAFLSGYKPPRRPRIVR